MKHPKVRRNGSIAVQSVVLMLTFSAVTFTGLATAPPELKPLAELGSCPHGTVKHDR